MARKIRAKLIMELRGQGVSRRAIASTRRMSMESVISLEIKLSKHTTADLLTQVLLADLIDSAYSPS